MPVRNGYEQGRPSWVDISSNDIDGSKAFYSGLFGWTWEDQEGPDGDIIYSMASKDGHAVCGLGPSPQEMIDMGVPTVLNTYIACDSVDAVHDAVVAAGGSSVVEPFDVMEAGRMAYVADDQGVHVGLWQAGDHKGAQLVNAPGAYTWAELFAPDTEQAVKFYAAALGLDTEVMDLGEMEYTTWKVGDDAVGGLRPPPMEQVPPHWHVYFGAASTEATIAKATELGAQIVAGPMDTPVGQMATIHDPQGGTSSVIQLNEWPD